MTKFFFDEVALTKKISRSVVTESRTAVARTLGAPEEGLFVEEYVSALIKLVRDKAVVRSGYFAI